MEVKNTPSPEADKPLMRDYWSKFRARTYVIVSAAQCGVMLFMLGLLELTGATHFGWVGFFLVAFIGAVILNAVTVPLIHWIGRPFKDLVQAIVLISGEPTAATPPNPNAYKYGQDGFKEILQTLYEMATRESVAPIPLSDRLDDTVKDGLAAMTTGIVIINAEHEIVYHNDAAPVRQDTEEKPILDILFPEDDTLEHWLTTSVRNKLSAEHNWVRVADKLPGEKDRRIFDITANYHQDSSAETVLVFFDRSKTYMPEEDDLDFISFAAHELRGPITVIRGYLSVLDDELQPVLHNDQKELMQRLVVASNRLTSYINNILSASRYDRRHMRLHVAEESLRRIYETVADDMQMRAQAQNRVLVVDIPDALPTVAADSNAVGEVLSNLIDNAIKYSNEGGLVHVKARAISGFVEVSIIDRGIGMPTNVIPNLFHKFYRSHRSRETVAGTGIGLYICKALVSSHGGSITARSIENEGSTFSFTIPIYDTVADKIKNHKDGNVSLVDRGGGWIKNHSLYKRL